MVDLDKIRARAGSMDIGIGEACACLEVCADEIARLSAENELLRDDKGCRILDMQEEIARLTRERDTARVLLREARDHIGGMPTIDPKGSDTFLRTARLVHRIEAATAGPQQRGDDMAAPAAAREQGARESEYRRLGIDPNNPNPDGSDYHLMNVVDGQGVKNRDGG